MKTDLLGACLNGFCNTALTGRCCKKAGMFLPDLTPEETEIQEK